jgi:hypothetical protein
VVVVNPIKESVMKSRRRRRTVIVGIVSAFVVAVLLWAIPGAPLSRLGWTYTLRPVSASAGGAYIDPNALFVSFPWNDSEFCGGMFDVSVVETPTRVTVSEVTVFVSLALIKSKACVRHEGDTGAAVVALAQPLGDREVVRASDGQSLPVQRG